jgi:hypothetical protein
VLELVPVAALAHERLVDEALGDDDVGERGQHRDVGTRPQRKMMGRLHVGRAHEIDGARIEHDQLGALAQPFLHPRAEYRMRVGRVGADQHHHVGMLDGIEILGAGRCAECLAQAVAGRRMADAGAGIDVVDAEAAANELLNQERFLVGAA